MTTYSSDKYLILEDWYRDIQSRNSAKTLSEILNLEATQMNISVIVQSFKTISSLDRHLQLEPNIEWIQNQLAPTTNIQFFITSVNKTSFINVIHWLQSLDEVVKKELLAVCNYLVDFNYLYKGNGSQNQISVLYSQKDSIETDKDIYLDRLMPVNGPISVFQYDNYLPIIQWLQRYFPAYDIQITSNRSKIKNAYLYMLSFRHFSGFVASGRFNEIKEYIPQDVLKDCKEGKCLFILNDSYEYTDYNTHLKYIYKVLKRLEIKEHTWIITGNLFQESPKFLKRIVFPEFKEADKRICKVRFFEDAVAELKEKLYPEFTSESRLNAFSSSNNPKYFLCLNRKEKDFRTTLCYLIFQHNSLDKFYISHPVLTQEFSFQKYADLISEDIFLQFKASLPWYLDKDNVEKIYWNTIETALLQNSFAALVLETSYEENMGSKFNTITEKTYKPIAFFMPFIIVGPGYSLKALKQDGYQTFSKWWDESYDNETHPSKRLSKISRLVNEICSWSEDKLRSVLQEMQPILLHNYQVLVNSKRNKNQLEKIIEQYLTL